jgi:hypothetical protein
LQLVHAGRGAGGDHRYGCPHVNLSLGGPADPLLNQLLVRILQQGRIVVAALPPDGNLAGFPVDAPGVIIVRMSDRSTVLPGVLNASGKDILTRSPMAVTTSPPDHRWPRRM